MTELLVRHLLVLGIACLLSLVLRRRSAALRHALWVASLALCAVLPLLQFVPLTLPADLVPPAVTDWPAASAAPDEPQRVTGASLNGMPQVPAQFPWTLLGLGIYTVVALALILRWLVGLQFARRSARRGRLHRVERGTPVVIVDGVGPLTFGWPRGVIIVPDADQACNELVLRHELAHVRRGDFLWQAIGALACALWWFSPAAWLAHRQLRREAELACDDCVLNAGASGPDYAQALLDVAAVKSGSVPTADALVPLITGTDLGRRIAAALAPLHERGRVRPWSLCVLVLVLLPFALSVSQPGSSVSAPGDTILAGRKIVLDPGHGGRDPGVTFGAVREADAVLAIAHRTKALLEQAGAHVTMTREGNDSLSLRSRAAAYTNQDLFLSIHVDTSDRTAELVNYLDGNSPAASLAPEFARVYAAASGAAGKLMPATAKAAPARLAVLKHATKPALLVNVALVKSDQDLATLLDPGMLDAMAQGLVAGSEAVLTRRARTAP